MFLRPKGKANINALPSLSGRWWEVDTWLCLAPKATLELWKRGKFRKDNWLQHPSLMLAFRKYTVPQVGLMLGITATWHNLDFPGKRASMGDCPHWLGLCTCLLGGLSQVNQCGKSWHPVGDDPELSETEGIKLSSSEQASAHRALSSCSWLHIWLTIRAPALTSPQWWV